MSTRACIAKATGPESWRGVYSHSDGYPSGLGKTIWDILHNKEFLPWLTGSAGKEPQKAVQAFCKIYIDGHPGGWSSFADLCYCHSPCFVLLGLGYNDMRIDSNYPDPLYMEWVYALDPDRQTMTIYSHRNQPADGAVLNEPIETADGKWYYGHCTCWHEKIAEISLRGREPVWEELDKR